MNWLDIIFVLALAGGTILGVKSGFVWQLVRMILLIISAYITFLIHPPFANWLASKMSDPFLAKVIIYIFIFVVIYLILFFISWFIERSVVTGMVLKPVDRVFGGIFGFFKTALICGTILLGFVYYPVPGIQQTLRNSFFGPYLLIYTRKVVFIMPKKYKRKVRYFIRQVKKEKAPSVEANPETQRTQK